VGLIGKLMMAADAMETHLLKCLPEGLIAAEAHWAAAEKVKAAQGNGQSETHSPLHLWSLHLISHPQFVNLTLPIDDSIDNIGGEGFVYSSEQYDGKYAFRMHISEHLNKPFVTAFAELTGVVPQVGVRIT
jgi:hypothetical protein